MAERRMFAKSITGSARFLMMPTSTRLLYYDLGMNADDDGIVEAFAVLRQTNASEDDLKLLAAKGFIKILNEDLVTFINDWKVNNFIRHDRYKPSFYKDLIVQIETGQPMVNQWSTNGQPMVNQWSTQDRLGKDSIGKDSIGKDSIGIKKENKEHKKDKQTDKYILYGEFENVKLTDAEYQKLIERFPADYHTRIERLSEYIAQTGRRYKSHYATILAWSRKDNTNNKKQEGRLDWIDTVELK